MFWFDNDFLFGSAFITIIFFIVFGSIAFMIVNGIITWSKNNRSPILTVPAKVVTKRTNIRGDLTILGHLRPTTLRLKSKTENGMN